MPSLGSLSPRIARVLLTLLTLCPFSLASPAYADDVASAVDFINSRLHSVTLTKVALPTILTKKIVAIYEIKRKDDADRPIVQFLNEKSYQYSHKLNNKFQLNLDDFCDSLSYTRMQSSGLYFMDVLNKRLDGKLKDDWAILLKEAIGEGLLAAYTFVTYVRDAKYNADISLLGSTVDGNQGWQESLAQSYTFPILPKTAHQFEYTEPATPFNVNKTYKNEQLPNLRANSVYTNFVEPIFANCKYEYRNINILDGTTTSKSDGRWTHSVRIYIHVYK